ASMALSAEQPPASSPLPAVSQPQVFQSVPKPLHSSGINVNAAPFQSMQTVFNLNAPVPPANEAESLKQSGQYQSGYSQGFSSQAQHPVDQPDMQPDQLQSVVGAFHSQDQTIPSTGGHQPLSQQPQQQGGTGFGRPGQSFYNSRAMPRGGPRNARGMLNGYRGPSNGFRGGYDGYRPPFSNTPSTPYGQPQMVTSPATSGEQARGLEVALEVMRKSWGSFQAWEGDVPYDCTTSQLTAHPRPPPEKHQSPPSTFCLLPPPHPGTMNSLSSVHPRPQNLTVLSVSDWFVGLGGGV
ncbi:hypothetical protein JZ751_016550, partial [Albula glossodonta]